VGSPFVDGVATVVSASSFCPLGELRESGVVRVLHPAFVHAATGGVTTFADAHVGMRVAMLTAAPESLAKLISQSTKALIADQCTSHDAHAFEPHEVIGALNIFCGGLAMAIDDAMPIAAEQLAQAVGHRNVMGICCFGEQGMNHQREPTHGNLMFGALLFSNRAAPVTQPASDQVMRPPRRKRAQSDPT
jgi:hypothetical protein